MARRWRYGPTVKRGLLMAGAVLFGARVPCVAQSPRLGGLVVDRVSALPLPGAVVSVLDSAGGTLVRATADISGRFSIARPIAAQRLRVIRIGYGPATLALPPSGIDTISIALVPVPAVLEMVRVSDSPLCPGSEERGSAFQIWEQVRAGLLAATFANRELRAASVTTLAFKRSLSPVDDQVRTQSQEVRRGEAARPFAAAVDASALARTGFMTEDATGRSFFGLDQDVLLDESFAATHCFRLRAADRARNGQIGLAFAPVAGRDALVEVNGVIWLHSDPLALHEIEFQFTGLEPAAMRVEPGGRVEFRTADNGIPVVTFWSLRMPVLGPLFGAPPIRQAPPGQRRGRTNVRVASVEETGGELVDIAWPDGTGLRPSPTGIAGRVTRRGNDSAVANATVSILEMPNAAVTDSMGAFVFAPLLPGRYTVRVVDTSHQAFAKPRTVDATADVRRGMMTPLATQLPALPVSVATRTLRGVVVDSGNRPVSGVDISSRRGANVSTNDAGAFRLQLASSEPVILEFRRLGFMPLQYSLGQGDDTAVVITMLPVVQQLATVDVVDRAARSARLSGFDQRLRDRHRATSNQYFITTEEIERRRPDLTSSLFGNVPGLRVVRIGMTDYGIASLAHNGAGDCAPTLYVDGARVADRAIDRVVQPQDIAGVEIYPTAGAAPPGYQSTGGSCAVILIWRK